MDGPNEGDLRVWWIPQVPMQAFNVGVPDLQTASLLLDVLANYDRFQFENNIKPDYSNAGGLTVFEGGEWVDYSEPETWADFDEFRHDPARLTAAENARATPPAEPRKGDEA